MLKILTPDEMAGADRAAISSGIGSFNLMKAAGRAVALTAGRMMGGSYGRRVAVLCGKGNNGGDGLVAALVLARRGVAVQVLLLEDPARMQGDAGEALRSLQGAGPANLGPLTPERLERELERSDLVVDALVGTGFTGALRGKAREAVEAVNRSKPTVLSVDIPSGVDGATGQIDGAAIRANTTVTLAALKPGLILHPGAHHAGVVEIADIGISDAHLASGLRLAEGQDVAEILPPRDPRSHKRSVGKVLIVAGSRGMSGAAILAAGAALRAGAGLVWVAAPASVSSLIEQSATEVVVRALPETSSGTISVKAESQILEQAEEADSVALGSGLGSHEETKQMVFNVLGSLNRPVILDADGLNAFAGRAGEIRSRSAPTVLTPHAGELARLIDSDVKHIDAGPVESARRAAQLTGAGVVLKGHPTFVAGSTGVTAVNTGGPFLSSAGTGDVLTGIIGALAAKVPAEDAAWAGAWLQGYAGRLAIGRVEHGGGGAAMDRGLLASDLLATLPEAIARVRGAGV